MTSNSVILALTSLLPFVCASSAIAEDDSHAIAAEQGERFYTAYRQVSNGPQQFAAVEARFQIEVVAEGSDFPVTPGLKGIASKPADPKAIERYAELFLSEFQIYPPEFVRRTKLKRVVLCRELSWRGQRRNAIPDNKYNTLYLDVVRGRQHERYMRRVIHHEFFHIVDQRDDGKLYQDARWAALNPAAFKYGSGGAAAQGEPTTSVLTDKYAGFLNSYSTTGVEEDKAEMFCNLIVNPAYVEKRADSDPVLSAKVARMKRLLHDFCPAIDETFWRKARATRAKVDDSAVDDSAAGDAKPRTDSSKTERTSANSPAKPNVLFLAVDDMKDWVNCLGGYDGVVHTPNIDRLAKRGMLFTNAHCTSPLCAPSRAATMTGMRPSTTGLYGNQHWLLPNLRGVVTMPKHFRNHGYQVVGAGKIFHHTAGNHPPNQWDDFFRITFRNDSWFRGHKLNYPWSEPGPNPQGFPFSGVQGLAHENDWGSLAISPEDYDDSLTADYAARFLKGKHDKPFFLACGLFRPHLPWYVPKKYFDLYSIDDIVLPTAGHDDLDDVPPGGLALAKARRSEFDRIRTADKWKHAVRAYLASVSYADHQLGRVLDALDKGPHAKNTIIVFWSDHGWHLGEKNHWHKSTLWEEATRVPFVISAPGYQPGVCARPVSLLDLYPTLNELTGLASIKAHEGVALTPLLRDSKIEWNRPAVIEYGRGNAAVRSDRYRYIRYRDGGEELYDHKNDPHEWSNLAHSEVHAAVKKELAGWIAKQWAESAPTKRAFHFDPHVFTWTNKKTGEITRGREN